MASEIGWLPDCVYTGDTFESGLAFFADGLGRIARFSREPVDLAAARRLSGQAALPGLVNAHSHAFHRILRGRVARRARTPGAASAWGEAAVRAAGRLSGEDVYDTARLAFLEMVLAGITCVGEFHPPSLHASEVLRAAHDVGIRIALLQAAGAEAGRFLTEAETLRQALGGTYAEDAVWLGVGIGNVQAISADGLKAIAAYAHSQRMRLHAQVGERTPLAPVVALAELGVLGKRFTAVHAGELSDPEIALLGSAKATVCACPESERAWGESPAPLERLAAAGAALCLGTDRLVRADLLADARSLPLAAFPPAPAAGLFRAASVTGARSLGAPGGSLEVGRPADFFTVNLFDPSMAGADEAALLEHVLFSLERRAIRDVWIGARQRTANGRHPEQGAIVGRFVDLQKRFWA